MLTRDATLLIKVTESSARSNPISVVPILLMNQRGEEEERGERREERGERREERGERREERGESRE